MPATHREFHNLKFGQANHAGQNQSPQRNARVDALLHFYGLFDHKVPLHARVPHSAVTLHNRRQRRRWYHVKVMLDLHTNSRVEARA